MTERRKFLRFTTNINMEYRICREKEIEGMLALRDLSRGGMGFSISKKLDRGTLLDNKLIPPGETNPIYLTGEVAWTNEVQQKKDFRYLAGIKFFKIDDLDRARLLDYVYNEWVSKT